MLEKIKKELKFSWEAYKIVCLNIPNIGKKDAKPITKIPWIEPVKEEANSIPANEESKNEEKEEAKEETKEKTKGRGRKNNKTKNNNKEEK